jgi:hypothetical protein
MNMVGDFYGILRIDEEEKNPQPNYDHNDDVNKELVVRVKRERSIQSCYPSSSCNKHS